MLRRDGQLLRSPVVECGQPLTHGKNITEKDVPTSSNFSLQMRRTEIDGNRFTGKTEIGRRFLGIWPPLRWDHAGLSHSEIAALLRVPSSDSAARTAIQR